MSEAGRSASFPRARCSLTSRRRQAGCRRQANYYPDTMGGCTACINTFCARAECASSYSRRCSKESSSHKIWVYSSACVKAMGNTQSVWRFLSPSFFCCDVLFRETHKNVHRGIGARRRAAHASHALAHPEDHGTAIRDDQRNRRRQRRRWRWLPADGQS